MRVGVFECLDFHDGVFECVDVHEACMTRLASVQRWVGGSAGGASDMYNTEREETGRSGNMAATRGRGQHYRMLCDNSSEAQSRPPTGAS